MKFTGQENQAEVILDREKNRFGKTETRLAQKNLKEKKAKTEEVTLPDFKTYYLLQ